MTGHPPGGGGRRHGRRVVAALAVTQTIGYGVLYYAFSVLLTPMARDLRASGTQVAAALTLAVLTSAACAPLVGRRLDRHGGHGLMSAGSVLATLALLGWSQATGLAQLYGVFGAVALAQAAGYGWVMVVVATAFTAAAATLLVYHRLPAAG